MRWQEGLDGWWMRPLDAQPLAFFRIAVGAFAVSYLLVRWTNLTSSTAFAPSQFAPVGIVTIASEPLTAWLVYALLISTVVMGVTFTTGWRFRLTGPLFAVLLLWVLSYRNSWGQVYHSENLLVLHVIVLGLVPAADALSLDARRQASIPSNARDYGWPLRLCALITVLTYFVAGWAKLDASGLAWVTSDALRNQVAYDSLRKALLGDYSSPLGTWLVGHGWAFKPLALATLVVELGAPLALLGRRVAVVWAVAAWLFHAGVLATMMIPFVYPLVGLAFVPLFAWDGGPLVAAPQRLFSALTTRPGG
jgi:hypothetical protein